MSSREEILARVKNSYQIPVDSAPTKDPVEFIVDDPSGDLIEEYINRASFNRSIVKKVDQKDLNKEIQAILDKEKVENLIYPNGLPVDVEKLNIKNKFKFDKQIEDFKDQIFDYDVSIIEAQVGVSSHGITGVHTLKDQPNTLSLTPKVCICLLKKELIVKSLSEALNKIFKDYEGKEGDYLLPRNIAFISGPSRTADIELITIIGVHGSRIFYVLIY